VRNYLIRRFLLIIPTFLGISLITFVIVQMAPGSPIYMRLHQAGGSGGSAITQEAIEQTKKLYGLDKPIHERYALWLGKLATFDFGTSYKDNRPVLTKIGETLPVTLQLNLISLMAIYLIAIPIGVYSATHQHTRGDTAITLGLFILYSLPSFWVAMLLMYYFCGGAHFNWFPAAGVSAYNADALSGFAWLRDRAWHLVLPVLCLSYNGLAGLSRYARAGLIETIRQDYVRTARAYGFSERTVIYRYALRNSLIPIVTLLGGLIPSLIGGSVIIESIFSIPGMGRLAFEAILSRDYPLIMGILSITALLTLLGLIVSDILYALVDPKIKFS
jgi:peptide/nickel transport system permease protein